MALGNGLVWTIPAVFYAVIFGFDFQDENYWNSDGCKQGFEYLS